MFGGTLHVPGFHLQILSYLLDSSNTFSSELELSSLSPFHLHSHFQLPRFAAGLPEAACPTPALTLTWISVIITSELTRADAHALTKSILDLFRGMEQFIILS